MSDLQVELELLGQLATDLGGIANEYEHADDFSADMADAVGGGDLGDRVREFSTKWNDRRKNMTEQVQALQQQVQAIHDAFTELDAELLKALQDGADDAAAGGHAPNPNAPTVV
jgi:uncharacterized protein YukE